MNDESTPKGAPESSGGDSFSVKGDTDDLGLTHRAFLAGYDLGLAHGQRLAVRHLAQELLHARALEMAGIAVANGARRYGSDWAESIARQAGDVR